MDDISNRLTLALTYHAFPFGRTTTTIGLLFESRPFRISFDFLLASLWLKLKSIVGDLGASFLSGLTVDDLSPKPLVSIFSDFGLGCGSARDLRLFLSSTFDAFS